MNNLAENSFVYSNSSCELILMTAAPEYLEFKVRKHMFLKLPRIRMVIAGIISSLQSILGRVVNQPKKLF